MSASAPTPPHDCGGDVAAYALGALVPAEAQAFRVHLDTCVVCRDELAAFERVVDVLAMSAPQYRAPADLRRRVLREVRGQAQGPPARRVRGQTQNPSTRRAVAWRPRAGLSVAAGVAALLLVAVLVAIAGTGASGTRTVAASVTGPGTAQIRVVGGRAELILRGFAAPPAGKIYEVWLQHGTRAPSPTPTLFGVTAAGSADVGVTGSLSGVTRLLVTPEPAGGSAVATHAPVITAKLT